MMASDTTPAITFAHLTDAGMARARNEDWLGAFEPGDPRLLRRRGRLFVVADGMGGHARGDVASRLAVDAVRAAYYDDGLPDELPQRLGLSVERANDVLYGKNGGSLDEARMGTTLTALVIRDGEAFIAHVGDSRAYLIRRREIRQLTEDHSLVSELVRQGVLTPAEAEHHPSAHVVVRAVGTSHAVPVALYGPLPLLGGDTLVLCTDGLSRLVAPGEIRRVAGGRAPRLACQRLVTLANRRGGPDNITLQVIRIGRRHDPVASVADTLAVLADAARRWRPWAKASGPAA
ncbi:MAG: PP2C family protein-serine/threonine phosphatase [Candidatus Rokuibacteriota bacterium]